MYAKQTIRNILFIKIHMIDFIFTSRFFNDMHKTEFAQPNINIFAQQKEEFLLLSKFRIQKTNIYIYILFYVFLQRFLKMCILKHKLTHKMFKMIATYLMIGKIRAATVRTNLIGFWQMKYSRYTVIYRT